MFFFVIQYPPDIYSIPQLYTVSPAIHGGYVPSPPENPRIIHTVLKRLCMISYTQKYASKTHSTDSLTH